jgi:hypothetical protein
MAGSPTGQDTGCLVMGGHTYSTKSGTRIYRYYVCYKAQKQGWDSCPCRSLPAEQIEGFVVEQIKRIGQDPALLSITLAKCREQAEAQRESINGELAIVERDLASIHADLARVAADAASSPPVSRPASHDRVPAEVRLPQFVA